MAKNGKMALAWLTGLCLAALPTVAQEAPMVPAAGPGASSLVSSGQNDMMKNADRQAREMQMRRAEQGRGKAGEALEKNKMRPKVAVSTPQKGRSSSTAASVNGWRFSSIAAVGPLLPDGKRGEEKDKATFRKAKALLEGLSEPTAAALMESAKKTMRDNGYYLFLPISVTTNEANRQLALEADFGHIQSLTITFAPANWPADKTPPTDGKWFRAAQIRDSYMKDAGADKIFNYKVLYDCFYKLNAHPDLTGALSLHAVTNGTGEVDSPEIRRLAMRLNVTETAPVHFVFGVDNSGTDAAENWMGRATVQYLNMTHHDDILTLNYQNSLTDVEALGGLAGSYYLPHSIGDWDDFALTLYGGYTDVDSKDVLDDHSGIDVDGMGWFVGLQESASLASLIDEEKHSLRIAVGVVRRYVEDNLVVQGEELEGNEVTVMPFSLALMYSDKQADALSGMNFATVEALTQFGDFMGTADEAEMKAQRAAADKDYSVLHVQLARLQMLPSMTLYTNNSGNPMLFARVNGQFASGALIPAEQFGLGGDGSVRGYATREYLGDHGVSGTLEFRLPIVLGLFDRKTDQEHTPWDRLQGVAFVDAGYVKIEDPLPGEEPDKALYGAGVGVRLAASDHFQLKCDLAFPLEKTDNSDDLCVHFNAQIQF